MATYCVLDANNTVITTFANSQPGNQQAGYTELPVDGGTVGQVWTGTAFLTGATPVPQSVSSAKMLIAMIQQGYYSQIVAYIGTLPLADQQAFARTTTFDRQDPLILSLAPAIPLTNAQLDALFIAAGAAVV